MTKRFLVFCGSNFLIIAFVELVYKTPFGGVIRYNLVLNLIHLAIGGLLLYVTTRSPAIQTKALRVFGLILAAGALVILIAPGFISDLFGYPVGWLYKLVYLYSALGAIYFGFVDLIGKIGKRKELPESATPPVIPAAPPAMVAHSATGGKAEGSRPEGS